MAIVRWDPFREMVTLRDTFDRLWDDSMVRQYLSRPLVDGGYMLIDVYQTDEDVVLKATMPGVKPEEVDISITGDTVTIKGEQKAEEETKEENYFYRERRFGTFSRSIQIPVQVQGEKAEAEFDNGVLTLKLPKAEEIKPKQIRIKPGKMIEGEKK